MTATTPAEETGSAPEPTGSQAPTWLPLAAVGVTLLLWASAFVAIRHLAGIFSPGSLSLGRLLVGSVCLGAVALGRGLPRPTRGQWVSIVTIGVLWFGIYNVALNAGEEHVDAGTAVMLIQVSPVLVALLAAIFLNERFTLYLGLGLALAFSGVALIATASGGPTVTAACWVSCCAWSPRSSTRSAWSCRSRWSPGCRDPRDLAGLHGRRGRLPAVRGPARRRHPLGVGDRHLVGRLPRRLPDRDRVHHVRLRAAHHDAPAAWA